MIDLKLPDPEAVRELWIATWRHLTSPFRSLLPEGLAEFVLVVLLLTLTAMISRYAVTRKYVTLALVGLWVAVTFSAALIKLGGG